MTSPGAAGGGPGPEPDARVGPDVDPSVLRSLTSRLGDRGPATVERLLDTWETEIGKRLAEVDAAVRQADPEALARAAHAIKGGSASLGAVGLAEVCAQVEDPIRAGEPVDLASARTRIVAAVEQARSGLGQLRVGSAG